MPNENEVKLIAALRSGSYKQITGALHSAEGFCCLGVACEVFRQETGRGRWIESSKGTYVFSVTPGDTDSSESILPYTVRKWLGWRGRSGECGPYKDGGLGLMPRAIPHHYLTSMNDHKIPFAEIAAHIEQDKVDKVGDGY